jgi:hypothetical protein
MIKARDIEELCRRLKPVIGDNADKLWYMYLAEDEKGKRDIALDIEIIAEKLLKKDALSKQKILLEPPALNNSSGSFVLGDIFYNDKKLHPLYLRPEDFIKQVGIFSVTGEGKTNLAHLLALQLLRSKTPFMVIDWKRSWRNLLSLKDKYPELKEVQVYTIGRDVLPFLWNPFRQPPGSDRELWISTVSEVLEKSHLSGPGVAYYCNRIYSRLLKGLNGDFYPNFFDGLKELENIKAYERELRWKQTALRIFNSFILGNASKAFNARNPIKLEKLFDKPVILELDLEMPKPLRVFFSEMILRWIHLYRLSQGETENLRSVLFLEEAHNLFTETGMYKQVNSLENIYREIRAFGQGIVSITQHPSMLPIYLLGNCHTQIYLGLQHADDIKTARKALFLKYDEESYPNILQVGECIVKIKNRVDPCLVKIPLVPVKKGEITDNWLKVNTPGYLPPLHDGNKSHKAGYLPVHKYKAQKTGKHPENNTASHYKLLFDIFIHPLSSVTQRYKRLKLNPKYGNKYKNLLIAQGCIQSKKIITGKGWITLFELTQKGKAVLRDSGYDFKDTREGVVHKFWKHKISEYYRKMNLEVLVEENINGRPDIIVINQDKKVAVEIETGNSDVIGNIQKRLKADFNQIICVATNRFVEDKIRFDLKKKNITDSKIKLISVFGFDIS